VTTEEAHVAQTINGGALYGVLVLERRRWACLGRSVRGPGPRGI